MAPSFDPELNLVYVGTSVTSPPPKFRLGGVENKHLNDHWDLDHPFERLLVDTVVRPDPAAVQWTHPSLRPGETGIVYTLDRATGGGLLLGGDTNGRVRDAAPELCPSSANNLFVFALP